MQDILGFQYKFFPSDRDPKTAPTLLLLHGTGGDEHDMLRVGKFLLPSANLLSPRGKVLEDGMPRWFRRFDEGVFDQEDLRFRTDELAQFITLAAERLGFDRNRVVAVGFSNGANIAASLLLTCPGTLAGAILFRAMVPLEPQYMPRLSGRPVLMVEGSDDPMIPRENAERLEEMLREAGANVTVIWQPGGHNMTKEDAQQAKMWLMDPAHEQRFTDDLVVEY